MLIYCQMIFCNCLGMLRGGFLVVSFHYHGLVIASSCKLDVGSITQSHKRVS